jgi:type I restriction enzyme R subunit
MKKALKDYAQGQEGLDEPPVQEKTELFELLDESISHGLDFCREKGFDPTEVMDTNQVFKNIGKFKEYADTRLSNDEWRKAFNVYENTITSLYEACKPEILGRDPVRFVAVFQYLRGVIESIIDQKDISAISVKIAELLDESVVVDAASEFNVQQHIPEFQIIKTGKTWDLSKINFEKLKEDFKQATYKHIEIADLRAFIEHKLQQMLEKNITRMDFAVHLQEIIDNYNSGGSSTENYFEDLMNFARNMHDEDERHVREGLTEDELELFDLIKKDKMTIEETKKVKLAAKSLMHRLLEEHPNVLVQDWYKDSQSQLRVRSAVEEVLDKSLPDTYEPAVFRQKCDNVFQMMLDYASRGKKWVA